MKCIIIALACILSCGTIQAQVPNKEAFLLLNLDYPGLEQIKSEYNKGNITAAAQSLLKYYQTRTGIVTPAIDLNKITISTREQKWADEALEHTFYVHDGYQPSFNYGKDIDWQHWPVKDNELRWQLHRHKWFAPMGKAYRLTKDERYAKEWSYQYLDWIKKNPLTQINKETYELEDVNGVKGMAENVRFAWRPLEASHRLQDQISQFALFIPSPSFTPEFLTEFLVNYREHADHILHNYSAEGNHLLFEAQRMLSAGAFFPEFKEASAWRKSGIDILNREIKKQVYDDGGQYELDLHYHSACIDIFYKGLQMADVNGFRHEFPQSYVDTIENMIMFYMNVCFPDYTNPCFSDAKRGNPKNELQNYREWAKLFPNNQQIRYFATQSKEGKAPANLSKGFTTSGFFTFRNGWQQDATAMVVKAGPKGEWHSQPDNGTFELWFNGKNLFPDSGSYIYGGSPEVMKQRDWFRQTAVHNTLTLDNKNLETTQSVTRLWQPEGNVQVLVTENPSYKDLKHRRSIFFVDNSYFVIVDEAIGKAEGTINLHYQLCDGKVDIDKKECRITTSYNGNSNLVLQCFASKPIETTEEEGWYSLAYRQRTERPSIAFNTKKEKEDVIRYISVLHPLNKNGKAMTIAARYKSSSENQMEIEVEVNGKKKVLKYQL